MTLAARLTLSVLVAALSPVVAWLVWVAPVDGLPGDAGHVAWFVTVAVGVVVAGALGPRRRADLVVLWCVAVASTMTTLTLWWSSVDESGLFVIGLVLAVVPVTVAAPLLVQVGRALNRNGSVRNAA